jgi:SAM-dependent methyltransferase
MLSNCPACKSPRLEVLASFPRSVTSDSAICAADVANVCCRECGLVSNATGIRGKERDFYARAYDLLPDTAGAEFTYETARGRRGIAEEMLDYLAERAALPREGQLLEIGCGKGVFLHRFRQRFPAWRVCGIEPSAHAREFLRRTLPEIEVHDGALETSPFRGRRFDLVASIGVLEHVSDPLRFLNALCGHLADSGAAFVSVPNFELNPADLFIADHLTRFTPASLSNVLASAGLSTEELVAETRVPMWALARRFSGAVAPRIRVDSDMLLRRARAAAEWAWRALDVYRRISGGARHARIRVGIYGTGLLAAAAVALARIQREQIACFFDDNPHLQNSERIGRPVLALSELKHQELTHLTFSANPCYLDRMESRAVEAALGTDTQIWQLPRVTSV